jgi:hypothetical protein
MRDTINRNNAPLPAPLADYSKKRKDDEEWSKRHKARVEIDARNIDKQAMADAAEVWDEYLYGEK